MDTLPLRPSGDDRSQAATEQVAAVVALKTLPAAKSRFAELPHPLR